MCFDRFKEVLYAATVFRHLKFKKPLVIDADASDQAVGAVPLQTYKNELYPVEYFSKIIA